MATGKLTTRKGLKTHEALLTLDHYVFELKTSMKISWFCEALEEKTKSYHKKRDERIASLGKSSAEIEGLKETIDYLLVGVKKAYNAPVLVRDFEAFDKEMEEALDVEFEIDMPEFKANEFTVDHETLDDKGKKKIEKKTILTPGLLRVLKDYITDLKEE